ncbi:MAG: hypothetical protein GC138_03950 [Gammaproteobacteria bacterium]|nr:hypothetical protein [Gammaproteobacteria bacterium]
MKKPLMALFTAALLALASGGLYAAEGKTMLFHLKTSLKHDDAQICVSYNEIWAALEEGLVVKVLVDADAINTFKVGWRGKDDIEDYKIPQNLRRALAKQFTDDKLDAVPKTYGEFLNMLHDKGAEFYVNSSFLVVAKIEDRLGTVENLSTKFFKPIGLKEMLRLRLGADYYMVY